jgi:hypothetical protein
MDIDKQQAEELVVALKVTLSKVNILLDMLAAILSRWVPAAKP